MNANGGGGSGSGGSTRNRISPSVSPSSSNRTSPKRERKRTTPSASTGAIAKINSAPPTMKEGNFFGSCQNQKQRQSQQQQLSPSSSTSAQQRKYSSSSSSGSSERCLRDAAAGGTMFPFDREALDYERIQRECFAPSSATASTSSDSEEGENCSVYERKLSADIFQQYSRLTQQEQQQQQHQLNHERDRDWERERERPPSRKNSKRIRPDSVIHTTIRENQQYVPQSDAFYPQTKSSSSPSDHSYAELNKFEDIASKFEQIPPKHGSNSTLNLQMLHMHSPGSESLASASLSPTDTTRKRSFKSKSKSKTQTQLQAQALEDLLPGSSSSAGAINVTANPLEAAAVCKQPRATIVVQQVSTPPSSPYITYIYVHISGCLPLRLSVCLSGSLCASFPLLAARALSLAHTLSISSSLIAISHKLSALLPCLVAAHKKPRTVGGSSHSYVYDPPESNTASKQQSVK